MRRPSSSVHVDGSPVTWLGANFWSRAGGPFMWRAYDGAVVRDELAVLKEHGLGLTRSFFFWPATLPTNRLATTMAVDSFLVTSINV